MELNQLFSAISEAIDKEAERGYHVVSITLSQKLTTFSNDIGRRYDCPVYYSVGLHKNEFSLFLRSSPSNRYVTFYRMRLDAKD